MLLARRAAAGDMSPPVADWLRSGLARYLDDEPLDSALRLDRAQRVRQRNRALRDAAALLDDNRGHWALAERLENAVKRFEGRVWPRVRHEVMPPLDELDAAMFRAFAADAGMLRCRRALYELIAE